jgi:hypothetical protein
MDIQRLIIDTSSIWFPIVVGVSSIVGLFFVKKLDKAKIEQIESCVKFVEEKFGKSLGSKTDGVLLVWLDALEEIDKSGNLTPSQMYDVFMQIVNKRLTLKSIVLNEKENATIKEAAASTISMLTVDSKRTVNAFQALSIARRK